MAADLQLGSMPPEPPEMVAADRAYYAELANGLPGGTGEGDSPTIALADTLFLHSRPSATKKIYLDFDGFTAVGTPWSPNSPLTSPAWDPDNNGAAFTNNELLRIQGAWQRVAADYAPFDVDVTTEDPGEAALVNTGSADDQWGIRVVITLDTTPAPGTGGVAYIGSFNWGYNTPGGTDTPCYVFNSTAATVSAAASHEVGHSLGLSHDGTTSAHPTQPSQEYYNGHGTGENSWGPIMGSGYYTNVTTWDNGVYFASSNGAAGANYGKGPNDLTVMTGYGFGFVPDAEADSLGSAGNLGSSIDFNAGVNNVSQFGVITQGSDVDIFRFQTGTGLVSLNFNPYITQTFVNSSGTYSETIESSLFDSNNWSNNQGANLDISATLYDSLGNVIATSDPTGLRASFSNLQLDAGVYYVAVDGVGFGNPTANPPDGYTDYASVGQYMITGSMPVALGLILPPGAVTYTEDSAPVQVTNAATVFDGIPGGYSGSKLDVTIVPTPGATDRLAFDGTLASLVDSSGNIQDGGQTIAVRTASTATHLAWTFTSAATAQSIEKLVKSVTFEATGNAPSTTSRSVRFALTKGTLTGIGDIPIVVITLNDAPSLQTASMKSILEDATDSAGQSVAEIFTSVFSDPDPNSSLKGVAVISNTTSSSEGVWQIAFGTSTFWQNLPAVSDSARLALGLTAKLRFIPGTDFNGLATPLQVRAIDDTYTGNFSTATNMVYLPSGLTGPTSPVSQNASNLFVNVIPVNDAPRPQVPNLSFSVLQNDLLNAVIPSGSVIDIDDTVLTYAARQADGSALPAWLSVDPITGDMSGIPGPFDVRTLQLSLIVTDQGGLSASLPVVIDVINVNDPPGELRFVGGSVKENQFGVRIGLVTGFDPDGDPIFWTSSDSRFVIRDGEVFLNTGLNFEDLSERQFNVTFRASDLGVPSLSSNLDAVITTLDVNEFYPQVESKRLSLLDGTPAGTSVDTVFATDGDTMQTLRYRLRSGDTSFFTINSVTGELRLAQDLDLNAKPQLKVFVEAYDDGTPVFATTAQYIVDVVPANFFAPVIDASQILRFSENLPANTLVGKVLASDQDGNPLQFEILSVSGGNANWLSIDAASGNLYTTSFSSFDFESSASYSVQVQVTETIAGGHTVSSTIPIMLSNVNDLPSGVAQLSIYTNRFGTPVNTDFAVQDQDPSATGYTVTTSDTRFEIRNGRLALKPTEVLSGNLGGQVLQVPLRIIDNSDSSSAANVTASVLVVAANAWQNPANFFDVNRDGILAPSDALQIIDVLNNSGSNKSLPLVRPFSLLSSGDFDTSGDNFLSAIDALRVINKLNERSGSGGEGEAQELNSQSTPQGWLAAFNQLEEESLSRKRR
ncbi:MAG: cadherin domain-containing protein [Pirellulales bacterium]